MQTFLPYADFAASAAALDDRRLGKQRVEALQIIRALTRETYGWKHHPAVLMWAGYELALASYGLAICAEWVARGRADTCAATMAADLSVGRTAGPDSRSPRCARTPSFRAGSATSGCTAATRRRLVRKDPSFYAARFPDADPDLPYFWPTHKGSGA